MSGSKSQNSIQESFIDIKVSLRLLQENWKAFLKTEIFAITAFMAFILLISFTVVINSFLLPVSFPRPRPPNFLVIRLPYFILIFSILIFYAFISSTYGLSHDIILSGDQFTEFEKSFTYFRRHFLSYTFLSLIILWIPIAIELDFQVHNFFELTFDLRRDNIELVINAFTLYLIQYAFFALLNLTLPSITAKDKLFTAFKENFMILVKNPIRILFSWGIFFVIFSLPSFLVLLISIVLIRFLLAPLFFVVGIIILLLVLSSVILGYPIMSLIATRIYATTKDSYEK